MWPDLVVVATPLLNLEPSIGQVEKPVRGKAFVAEADGVEDGVSI
jgi:hypothetical protein